MLYSEFITKAKEVAVHPLDNGIWYLEPDWRLVLADNALYFNDISDYEVSPAEVKETLELEVERRNKRDSKQKEVMDWLYDLITATVEPAIMQEETDYIKQVVEFMKANHGTSAVSDNIVPFPAPTDNA